MDIRIWFKKSLSYIYEYDCILTGHGHWWKWLQTQIQWAKMNILHVKWVQYHFNIIYQIVSRTFIPTDLWNKMHLQEQIAAFQFHSYMIPDAVRYVETSSQTSPPPKPITLCSDSDLSPFHSPLLIGSKKAFIWSVFRYLINNYWNGHIHRFIWPQKTDEFCPTIYNLSVQINLCPHA